MSSRKQRILAVVLITIAVVGVAVGAAFGYLSDKKGPVTNTFTPDQETDPVILETTTPGTGGITLKKNVKVDVGDPGYAVYVRAALVFTWEEAGSAVEDNAVYPQMPVAGTDYDISLNSTDWFLGTDGFYYHRAMVKSGEDTSVLINSCSLKAGANIPDGYQLHVEIIAQTIQALGKTDDDTKFAVEDAWKVVTVSNGELVKKT